MTAPLYSSDGKSKGEVTLEATVFGIEPNVPVLHQVVTAQLAAARAGTHHTKTRAEVRGGGRKPWRQKGLGRARHGSIRSPSWTGGGVAHGPKPRDYSQRTPKKMKRLALRSALSARAADGQIRIVEGFDWDAPKTKKATDLLSAMDVGGKVLVVLDRSDDVAYLSLRNVENVVVNDQVNPYDILWADTVIFTVDTLAAASGTKDYSVGEEDFVKETAVGSQPSAVGQNDDSVGDKETAEADVDADSDSEPMAESREPRADSGESGEAAEEEST
ncbi:MAG: 50S ribosomal protein L4 [Acidimicrobiia bacterium]|nr:50S ribosomal protein L4 [Acidimicrobiia bacterium]